MIELYLHLLHRIAVHEFRLYAKIRLGVRPSTILPGVNVLVVNIEQFLQRSSVPPFIAMNDVAQFIH